MPIESATYISQLTATYPDGNDDRSTADDHLRLIKSVLKASFPNLNAAVTPTPTEFNVLVGKTAAQFAAGGSSHPIPAGTKMVFAQAAAPTGWTQDASQNDRVLRVVSGAGAGVGGSWTVSGLSGSAHTHGMAHTHESPVRIIPDGTRAWQAGDATNPVFGVGTSRSGVQSASGGGNITSYQTALTSGASTVNTGDASATGVSSNGAWRPAYLDIIVASKN